MGEDEVLTFLFQKDAFGNLSGDSAAIMEAIHEQNWLRKEETPIHCEYASTASSEWPVNLEVLQHCVPVGDIDFVDYLLRQAAGKSGIRPIYIPAALMQPQFLGRKITSVVSAEEILQFYDKWHTGSLFIKSGSKLKCDFAGAYRRGEQLPKGDSKYLVSEPLNILTEWRAFVFHGQIRDIRCYNGDPWLIPSKPAVEAMVTEYTDCPPAYTLDVAVTEVGTYVLEVHNFVCCGLYGFADSKLIPMLSQSWGYELSQANPPHAGTEPHFPIRKPIVIDSGKREQFFKLCRDATPSKKQRAYYQSCTADKRQN